jgi:hypothetical protein
VIQGDFLFSKEDVTKKETIDGQNYTTFHPNTIIYAVPYDQAKTVRDAKIGVRMAYNLYRKRLCINESIIWC